MSSRHTDNNNVCGARGENSMDTTSNEGGKSDHCSPDAVQDGSRSSWCNGASVPNGSPHTEVVKHDEMSSESTRKIMLDEIRRLINSPKDEELFGPFPSLSKALSREPVVFLAYSRASTGDRFPFLRVANELAKSFPGRYHLLLDPLDHDSWPDATDGDEHSKGCVNTSVDQEAWLNDLESSECVDAVITNSTTGWYYSSKGFELLAKMYSRLCGKNAAWIEVEFNCHIANTNQEAEWARSLAVGNTTMPEYEAWCQSTRMDDIGLQRDTSAGLPHLILECYPAELLSKQELDRTSGILCGHVEPLLPLQKNTSPLDFFIAKAHGEHRRIILLARGGGRYRNAADNGTSDLAKVSESMIALGNVAVVAVGNPADEIIQQVPNLFVIQDAKFQCANFMSKIAVVVHHGGAGTMLTAIEHGTPQVIVPRSDCCPDQLFNGNKIVSLGCGIMLRPRTATDKSCTHNDIAQAVDTILHSSSDFNDGCTRWAKKLQPDTTGGTDTIAVDGLRRLIAGIMLDRQSDLWEGWTEDAKAADMNRFGSWTEFLQKVMGKAKADQMMNWMKDLRIDDGVP